MLFFKNRLNKNKLLAAQPPFLKLTPENSPPTKQRQLAISLLHQATVDLHWSFTTNQQSTAFIGIEVTLGKTSGTSTIPRHRVIPNLRCWVFLFFPGMFFGGNPVVLYLSGRPWMSRELFFDIFWMVANKTKTAKIEEIGQLQVSPQQKVLFF